MSDGAPHLVLIVGNPVQHDARVRKTALSAASFGLRVTVVALTSQDERFEEQMGPVRVVNVPVQYLLRDRATDRRRGRRRLFFPFGYGTADAARAEARRRRVADLELMSRIGRVRRVEGEPPPPDPTWSKVARRTTRQVNRLRRRVVVARTKVSRYYSSARFPRNQRVAAWWYAHRPVGNWRRLLPEYLDLEIAFGPVLDELDPDLIHANDVNMIGIASNAVDRARLRGRRIRWIYDAHEYVPGMSRYRADRIAGMADHEKEYIGAADAVLTVSEPIADAIQRRTGLAERPTVVLNTALARRPADRLRPSVRAVTGLADEVPLLVYSGNIDPDRGITTLVQSLAHLPADVHVVIVTNAPMDNRYIRTLTETAESDGTRDRLHFAPYVPGDQIIDYLSTGSVGVHGLNHVPNHEMALPNKLFDYLHAGLPMVVSDVKAMAKLITELGVGEVYVAGDAVSLADAVQRVLADRDRYRAALTADPEVLRRFSWERQEEILREVYGRLLGRGLPFVQQRRTAVDLGPARHVVLVGAGDVLADQAVLELAQSLANAGLQVTAVGTGPTAVDLNVVGVRLLRVATAGPRNGSRSRWARLERRALAGRALRREVTELVEALRPVVAELRPDVLQLHDPRLIGLIGLTGLTGHGRAEPGPRTVLVLGNGAAAGASAGRQRDAALERLVRRHAQAVDRVLVTSEAAAGWVGRAVPNRPPVLVPLGGGLPFDRPSPDPTVRQLFVWFATPEPVDHEPVLRALATLPEARATVLAGAVDEAALLDGARRLGLVDRVALAARDAVPAELARTADAALLPLVDPRDQDLTLDTPTSLVVAAGVGVVAGTGPQGAGWLSELGLGAPFPDGDSEAMAAAVRLVLDDASVYRARLAGPVVRSLLARPEQAAALRAVYRDLAGPLTAADAGTTALWVGPTNSAGQGYEWARALERHRPDVRAEVWTLAGVSAFEFPSDVRVPAASWSSRSWALAHARDVRHRFSHVLMESGRGALGTLNGGEFGGDLEALRRAGISAGVVFHGSEVRSPRLHRQLEPTSPFRDPNWELGQRLQVVCDRIMRQLEGFDGPRFVSTLDLLDYVPDAQWLPVVVDPAVWTPGPPVLERQRPVLLHVPSNPELKGSAVFEPIAQQLAERGLVEYRRAEGVPVDQMPALVRDADIVFDQFSLGLYGVQAAQAMAAGRLVVSYVGDRIRDRLPAPLPILEATPGTLVSLLEEILADRDTARDQAAQGPAFVREFHDGRLAAEVLGGWVTGASSGRSMG